MSAHLDDEARVQLLKQFWSRYGKWCLLLLLIVIAGLLGWQYFKMKATREAETASVMYQNLIYQQYAHHEMVAHRIATDLMNRNQSSVYADFAGLYLAAQSVKTAQLEAASTQLKWVITAAKAAGRTDIVAIAVLRLARVQMARAQFKAAAESLDKVRGFVPLVTLARAKLAVDQHKLHTAERLYQTALTQLPPHAPMRAWISLQISQLPVTSSQHNKKS